MRLNSWRYQFHSHCSTNLWDYYARCRWSTNAGESLLFVKYNENTLNILDAEKKTFTLGWYPRPFNDSNCSYIFFLFVNSKFSLHAWLVFHKCREERLYFFFLKLNWKINFMTFFVSLFFISLLKLDNI